MHLKKRQGSILIFGVLLAPTVRLWLPLGRATTQCLVATMTFRRKISIFYSLDFVSAPYRFLPWACTAIVSFYENVPLVHGRTAKKLLYPTNVF